MRKKNWNRIFFIDFFFIHLKNRIHFFSCAVKWWTSFTISTALTHEAEGKKNIDVYDRCSIYVCIWKLEYKWKVERIIFHSVEYNFQFILMDRIQTSILDTLDDEKNYNCIMSSVDGYFFIYDIELIQSNLSVTDNFTEYIDFQSYWYSMLSDSLTMRSNRITFFVFGKKIINKFRLWNGKHIGSKTH